MFLAECQASGKAWATPWSVMAMARWPQDSARLTTFLSGPALGLTWVRASMDDMVVCKCSSTRFSGASSVFTGLELSMMAKGSSTMSPVKRSMFSLPWMSRCCPFFTPSTMGLPSSPGKNLDTRTEPV